MNIIPFPNTRVLYSPLVAQWNARVRAEFRSHDPRAEVLDFPHLRLSEDDIRAASDDQLHEWARNRKIAVDTTWLIVKECGRRSVARSQEMGEC